MEDTNAAQKNVDRARSNPANSVIYRNLKSTEEELSQLTDEEFEILQIKLKPPTSAPTSAPFYFFTEGSDAKGLKGDETALSIYKRIIAAHPFYFDCFYRYSRVFSFARKLGVTNIYDIGCGNQLQAFLMMYAPEMNYTGIDMDIFHDYADNFEAEPAYINELFGEFTGNDRIRHIKETYPCALTVAENNAAVFLGVLLGSATEERVRNMGAAFSRDFERVVLTLPFRELNLAGMPVRDIVYKEVEVWTNPFEKYYDIWKNAMPDFEFYKIGDPNYVFATKTPEDREKLEKRYTLIGDRVLTGAVDVPWYSMLIDERM